MTSPVITSVTCSDMSARFARQAAFLVHARRSRRRRLHSGVCAVRAQGAEDRFPGAIDQRILFDRQHPGLAADHVARELIES